MSLLSGSRVGPYEIAGAIGAGGMGEVYRARDTRLQRDVAIKVLPDLFLADPDRRARFEREAQALAALSHPNVAQIYGLEEIPSSTGASSAPAIVMELLEGATLRERLESAMPVRRAIDVAIQIAHGLAAAHDKGIVHRDLKPENIFITSSGHVKLLDFGLARSVARADAAVATMTGAGTAAGVVLGTVGYMSPEQVRGGAVDHRSDIFALGAVLYEMLGGQRPFRGDTAIEAMNAILKEDPPDPRISDPSLAPALSRIVRHCLEKEPSERFQSARDLAFNLEAVRSGSDASGTVHTPAAARRRLRVPMVAALCGLSLVAGAVLAGAFLGRAEPAAAPVFTRLTNEKGTLWFARFTPDGQSVIYSASWDGKPIRSFLTRADRLGATPLALPDGAVLAVSSKGELAIGLGQRFDGWMGRGTLARGPMFGAAPRPIAEQVREADWLPDGSDLAVVRRLDGRERLELPIGHVLFDTSGYISHIRVSKDGARVAFANHPFFADDNGDVAIVDRAGTLTTLVSGLQGLRGVAWSPRGDEIWFTANSTPHAGDTLRAVTLDGHQRVLLTVPTESKLLDVASDGRVLLAGENDIRRIELFARGASQPRDLGLFSQSMGSMIAPDGRGGLITDQGSVAGTAYATYYWRADRDDIVRLGEGQAADLSPDGRYALSIVSGPPSRLQIQPTGAGEARALPNPDGLTIQAARYLKDGAHVFFIGGKGSGASRGWVQTIASGAIVPVTDTGVDASAFWNTMPLSPDGRFVSLIATDGAAANYPIAGGAPEPLRGLEAGEFPLEWTPDGREMYVAAGASIPNRIVLVNPLTGQRRPWKEITASQPAGVRLSQVLLTPDGSSYVHTYAQLLSTLFVASGVQDR